MAAHVQAHDIVSVSREYIYTCEHPAWLGHGQPVHPEYAFDRAGDQKIRRLTPPTTP